ncbi:MAG: hypothetical protein HY782_06360 [Chloroflexi bacterium]|nr:hypothetical protein [Chloroflexota bacterium]
MRRWLLLLLLPLGLSACVGWPSPQSNATGLDDLALILWTSHRNVNVNQPVTIRFTVRNEGKQTVVYDRKDKPVADILIPGGFPKVRWSDGKPLTAELTRLELKPGESRVLEMIWAPGPEYKQQIYAPVTIAGRVWWCADKDTCYNEIGLGVGVELPLFGP